MNNFRIAHTQQQFRAFSEAIVKLEEAFAISNKKMDEFHEEARVTGPLLESKRGRFESDIRQRVFKRNFPFVLARLERISAKRRNTNTLRKSDKNHGRYSEWRKLCVSFRIRRRGIFRTDIRKILGRKTVVFYLV